MQYSVRGRGVDSLDGHLPGQESVLQIGTKEDNGIVNFLDLL